MTFFSKPLRKIYPLNRSQMHTYRIHYDILERTGGTAAPTKELMERWSNQYYFWTKHRTDGGSHSIWTGPSILGEWRVGKYLPLERAHSADLRRGSHRRILG